MTADALAFLTARSLRNRVRVQISRLKNVRYLLGLAFIIAYFALVIRPDRLMRMPRDPSAMGFPAAIISDVVAGIAALGVFLLAGWWWAFGARLNAIAVSPAEAQLLIPGPISRTQLLLYKIGRSQLGILFSALILALITMRRGGGAAYAVARGLGYFVVLSTLSLHKIGATLTRAGTRPPDAIRGVRKWLTAAVVTVVVAVPVILMARRAVASFPTRLDFESVVGAISAALAAPPLGWLLLPFRAMVAPLHASSPGEWTRVLPIAIAIMLLHIPWILATRAPIEETAIATGARRERIRAAMRAARRSGGRADAGALFRAMRNVDRGPVAVRPVWVKLPPHGPAWVAVVWKNLVPLMRGLRWVTALFALVIIAALGGLVTYVELQRGRPLDQAIVTARNVIGVMAAAVAVISVLVGPLYSRNDFRGDLPYLRVLRTLPLSSAELVGAEVASASLALLAAQVPMLIVAWLLPTTPSFGTRTVLFVGALLVITVLDVLGVSVRNAIALAFPGWVKLGGDAGGVEQVGYNVLGSLGALLLLGLLLLAPVGAASAILVGAGITSARSVAVGAATVAAIVAFLAITALELRFLFRWLGTIYDHIDAGELLEPA
ncbi:MAG TPA: putative ABC exporter domain-containing protein [Gemmatimonadaceae bacterium]|nr:putative ABC exporter domain-containing protein [Gemmatimonadaceae bacterium]